MPEISQEELKKVLEYTPNTGVFIWRKRLSTRIKLGDPAGNISPTGYLEIRIHTKLYGAHRLAWLYVHGSFPEADVDHINGVRHDNRISNLRPATRTENNHNLPIRVSNTSGHQGVSWDKDRKKWLAQLSHNKTRILFKRFESQSDAISAYENAKAACAGNFYPDKLTPICIRYLSEEVRFRGKLRTSIHGSAGYDLLVNSAIDIPLASGEAIKVGSGIAIWIRDNNIAGKIYARSGSGSQGLVLTNGTGIIDCGYQGEIFLSLYNNSKKDIVIAAYSRVAQLVFTSILHPNMLEVSDFSAVTERGLKGFGSTGK